MNMKKFLSVALLAVFMFVSVPMASAAIVVQQPKSAWKPAPAGQPGKVTITIKQPAPAKRDIGVVGTEVFTQETVANPGNIGASVPSGYWVYSGKVKMTIKNTGKKDFLPVVKVNGQVVYTASRAMKTGEKVTAIVAIPEDAKKCVTELNIVEGGKFTITSNLTKSAF